MKHILYYDKDIINSYAAQIFKGLPTKTSEETAEKTEQQFAERYGDNITNIEIALGLIRGGHTSAVKDSENSEAKSHYSNELTEKVYHDEMLTLIINNIHENGNLKLNGSSMEIGDYVCLTKDWKFLDIKYIKNIVSKTSWSKIKDVMKIGVDKRTANQQTSTDFGIDNIRKAFEALEIVLPFSQIIKSEKCCFPINPVYLRETFPEINFKYATNKITIFGRVTNQFKSVDIDTESIDDIMTLIGNVATAIIPDNSYIITPIALYVE